ncbi:hypothetical protein IWX90DRAFT_271801 [Phyllosticta citrichinensis]|uniref:Uncharacterized protein n=1 Tax=Phyllosticta citrichinensis TaxID=1130410 RepID=A0ABR1XMX1_9PEZI
MFQISQPRVLIRTAGNNHSTFHFNVSSRATRSPTLFLYQFHGACAVLAISHHTIITSFDHFAEGRVSGKGKRVMIIFRVPLAFRLQPGTQPGNEICKTQMGTGPAIRRCQQIRPLLKCPGVPTIVSEGYPTVKRDCVVGKRPGHRPGRLHLRPRHALSPRQAFCLVKVVYVVAIVLSPWGFTSGRELGPPQTDVVTDSESAASPLAIAKVGRHSKFKLREHFHRMCFFAAGAGHGVSESLSRIFQLDSEVVCVSQDASRIEPRLALIVWSGVANVVFISSDNVGRVQEVALVDWSQLVSHHHHHLRRQTAQGRSRIVLPLCFVVQRVGRASFRLAIGANAPSKQLGGLPQKLIRFFSVVVEVEVEFLVRHVD